MKFKSSEFVKSAHRSSDFINDQTLQVAFVGRSNVGKSSLINAILNRKKLAKISSVPGKTRAVNYFNINNDFYVVDLPGYGYNRAGKAEHQKWSDIIEKYLTSNNNLAALFILVDIRHDPTEMDKQMMDFLYHYSLPFFIIATKSDKIPKNKIKPRVSNIANSLGVGQANIITTSSKSRVGIDKIIKKIEKALYQIT